LEGKITVREKIILGVLVLLLVSGGAWRAAHIHRGPNPEISRVDSAESALQPAKEAEPVLISVHLVGAVNKPGVYQLAEGSRVYELLELGGGFTEEADREGLNQARPLFDGEQVYVSRIGEKPPAAEKGTPGLININRASAAELTSLPGIGEVRAAQIIEHREKHGYFKAKEDIMEISGIGQAIFDNIADMITVY